ncbi:hypothetical protein GGG16DRAFT_84447 [Schizophyllum commune]
MSATATITATETARGVEPYQTLVVEPCKAGEEEPTRTRAERSNTVTAEPPKALTVEPSAGQHILRDAEWPTSVKPEDMRVTFIPPLFLQRRVWILDILRNEKVTEVLDVGCGEGSLLSTLCQPAPWLDPPDARTRAQLDIDPALEAIDVGCDEISNLHIRKVTGLDLFTSTQDLDFAKLSIAPPRQEEDPYGYNTCARYESMEARLYRGGLEVVNDEFVNAECIVATEVIEHLDVSILPFFAPVLMGVYHPRLFLITTPNYAYNARFSPPLDPTRPEVRPGGYSDPTGRTDRVFRHADHKFEWTTPEFEAYCTGVAQDWGYEVAEMSAVGRAMEEDPWGREDELGSASFVCCFRRKDLPEAERQELADKARRMVDELASKQVSIGTKHELLDEVTHQADDAARHPASLGAIADRVTTAMRDMGTRYVRLEELWFNRAISRICGGWLEMLVWAVERSPDLELRRREINTHDADEVGRSYWHIEFTGLFSEPPTPAWDGAFGGEGEEGDDEDEDKSVDLIPPDWEPSESEAWSSSTEGVEGDVSEAGPSNFVRGPGSRKRGFIVGSEHSGSGWSSEDVERSPMKGWEEHGGWDVHGDGHGRHDDADGEDEGEGWGDSEDNSGWGGGWGWDEEPEGKGKARAYPVGHFPLDSSASSAAGWDGDQSDGSDTS